MALRRLRAVVAGLIVLSALAPPLAAATSDEVEPTMPGASEPAPAPLPPGLARVPPPVLDVHTTITTCEDPASAALAAHPPLVAELTPVALLVALPCAGDADEAAYRLYVLETGEIGGVHPLVFALPSKSLGWAGTELLWRVGLDGEGRLTGVLRDPGEGRCLSRGSWRWNGYAFVLETAEIATGCGPGVPPGWLRVHPPAE